MRMICRVITLLLILAAKTEAFTLENNFFVVGNAQQSALKLVFDSFVIESLPSRIDSWGKNQEKFTFRKETILLYPKHTKPLDVGNLVYIVLAENHTYDDVGRVEVIEQKTGNPKGVLRAIRSVRIFDRNGKKIPYFPKASAVFQCVIEDPSKNGYLRLMCTEAAERDGGYHTRALEFRANFPPSRPKVPLRGCEGENIVKNLDGGSSFRACGQAGFTPGTKKKKPAGKENP